MLDFATARRLVPIVLLLFPGLWGLLSLLNNLSDFAGTAETAVKPLIAMTDTDGDPAQTWRAITAPWAAPLALGAITATETLAGVLALTSVGLMLRDLRAPGYVFNAAKVPGILGCLAAVAVWGIGFMVIGGDWFLSWQGKDGIMGQLGGLVYALPATLALVFLVRED
jgi:predicted small integral membrane protein